LRILQVEDSADDAELILRQLRQGGFEVQALRVETAEAMREALETGEWDIIFSDYQVPGFGGLQALEVLKASGLDIPFILISGAVGEEIAVSVMKSGAHDYLQKGHLARLAPAVERELKEAAHRRQEGAIKEALQESEGRYRDLFQHQPIPTWIQDLSGVKTLLEGYRNRGVRDLNSFFEAHPDEVGRCANAVCIREMSESSWGFFGGRKQDKPIAIQELFVEASWGVFRGWLIALAEGFQSLQGDLPIRDLAGNHKIVSCHLSVSPGYETSLGRVLASFLDVTERYRMESVLKESQASLERAQALAHLGSWEWDLLDRNPAWSPELFRIFGLEPWAPAPDYDHYLERVLPEDRPLVLGTIEQVIASGKPMGLEYRIQTLQGEIRHVYERAEPVLDERGRTIRLRGTIQDITERKRMERVIEDMGRVSAKGRLAAYIAHEINNPLAGIKNAFQLVERALPEHHPHAHYAELIKREIDRIASIIRTMYHVYRPPTPEIRDVSLFQAFQDIESLLLPKLRTSGVETVVELQDPDMKVRMNEGLLRQVLFNLVLNAIDASPKGGQVVLGALRTEDECCITVEDQGPGIPPELAERVFESGFTTKRDAAMSGLGLGLSTCRNIVESMGGSLCFGSGPEGQGTVFRVCLPSPPPE